MNDFRNRPKGTYIQTANWKELYVLTEHWKSDLNFYKDDLRFLKFLIKKYFIWLTIEENLSDVKIIGKSLHETEDVCKNLIEKVNKHLIQLGHLSEDTDLESARIFRIEHEHLEDELAEFVKTFRINRKKVFKITEHIVDSEKLEMFLED